MESHRSQESFQEKRTNWAAPQRSEHLPGGKGIETSMPTENSICQVTKVERMEKVPCGGRTFVDVTRRYIVELIEES